MDKKKKLLLLKGMILIIVIIMVLNKPFQIAIKEIFFILSSLNVDIVRGYILSFGIWAPVVSSLLMIFQSIVAPLPAFMITFANAGLFGWVNGAILSWVSSMIGASICFWLSKKLGRNFIEKLSSKFALDSIDMFFNKHGKYAVIIARLLPFISFDIVSYGAGLTSMKFGSFIVATGIGQLPATIIYSYVGGMLTGGTKKLVFGLLILFAISTLVFLIKKISNEKNRVSETI